MGILYGILNYFYAGNPLWSTVTLALFQYLNTFVSCSNLQNVSNAYMTSTGHNYGYSVNCTCHAGYAASSGNLTRQCGHDCMWSGSKPTCPSKHV